MNVRRSIAVAAALLAAPALTSCGFDAPTDQVYNPTVGTFDKSSSVDVLHALIVSDSDGSGTLVATLVNNDLENEDRLVALAGTDTENPVEVTVAGETTVEAGGLLKLSDGTGITVSGDEVVPGFFVSMRFTFDRGRAVELNVPVEDYNEEGPFAEVPLP